MHEDFDGYLYHAAPASLVTTIQTEGLKPGTYFGTSDIAAYYADDIEDTEPSVMLSIPYEALAGLEIVPDMPGLEEPISTVVGMSEDEIRETWSNSAGSWEDCFRIVGSLRCMDRIAPEHLVFPGDELAPEP